MIVIQYLSIFHAMERKRCQIKQLFFHADIAAACSVKTLDTYRAYSMHAPISKMKLLVSCNRIVHHQGWRMMKQKLNWRTPLFFCLLPIFLVMIFLGFPLPVAPPPKNKPVPTVSIQEEKRKRKRLDRIDL